MKIEKVSTADAEELLAIYAPYVEETAISFEYEVPSVDEFRNRIEQISAKYPYIKAVVDGKIAGYAYAAGFKDRKAYDWSVETTIYIRKDDFDIFRYANLFAWKQRYISEKTAGSWGLAKPYMRIWKNY